MCPTGGNSNDADAFIRKLAGFQTVIPQFDNLSSITPNYFLDNVENITKLANCSKNEQLMVLKSRIRGDALTNVISYPDLNNETDYDEFKKKFLAFFKTQYSLSARQKQFSNCQMMPNEQVKTYAAKVGLATENFFNTPDLTNDSVKSIFEQTKLAKFIEGLLPTYKQSVILKDPKTFQSAVEFVQLLQSNEISTNNEQTINNISTNTNSNDIKNILEAHALNTQEMINTLSKEVEQLKLKTQQNSPQPYNNYSFQPSQRRGTGYSRYTHNRNLMQRSIPTCRICQKAHFTSNCFNNPANRGNFRGRNNGLRRNGRASYTVRFNNREQRSQSSRDYQQGSRNSSGNF